VRFAAEEITWSTEELWAGDHASDNKLGTVAAPLYRRDGLAAAVQALRSGQCVVVEEDAVTVMEAPAEMQPSGDEGSGSQRNVPQGRSWLPHEFM
jgi:hypothetical protein